jgi:PAS domain-containing protein
LYWTRATEVLSRNDKDIPFALLYSIDEDESNDAASNATRFSENNQQCTLRGSIGLPEGSLAGPCTLDLGQDHGFTPYFREAINAREPVVVPLDEGSAAAELVRGIDWQGFGEPARAAVVCPLNPTSSRDNILGFMVIGLNPRRPYEDNYRQFLLVASRLLSTSLTSILLHEEEIGRRERTIAHAEAMKVELSYQLLESQKEVHRNELKFRRFAERADIGIYIINMDGVYQYRNDAWYTILAPRNHELVLEQAWEDLIDDEYIPIGRARFDELREMKSHQ